MNIKKIFTRNLSYESNKLNVISIYNKDNNLNSNKTIIEKKIMNNELKLLELKKNKNLLFTNLLLKKLKIFYPKSLKIIQEKRGNIRHNAPAVHEWNNSIYTYNKSYQKTLTTAHNTLINMLEFYFNLEVKNKLFKEKKYKFRALNNRKNKSLLIKAIARIKKNSTKKIFLSKGTIKHTNSNIISSFFIYNTEKMVLNSKVNLISNILFKPRKKIILKKKSFLIKSNNPYTLKEYLDTPKLSSIWYYKYLLFRLTKINKYLSKKIHILSFFKNIINNKNNYDSLIFKRLNNISGKLFIPNYEFYIEKRYWRYTIHLYKYLLLLRLNRIKFSKEFINKFNRLANNIYNKNITFNFINLNNIYSNSDIFLQSIVLKLKSNTQNKKKYIAGRKYRNYKKLLTKFLSKANIFYINKLLISKKKNYNILVNKIKNFSILSMSLKDKSSKDSLNKILFNLYNLKKNKNYISKSKNKKLNPQVYLLSKLKFNKLSGIRLEIKGRLLDKLSASRSKYKMLWKGSLKNVDSSYKGISTSLIRGYAKSNVQYTFASSITKSGAYGIKGWISAK